MRYISLSELIRRSSSSRKYFLSLPVGLQLYLHRQDEYIHCANDLHFYAENRKRYDSFCEMTQTLTNKR